MRKRHGDLGNSADVIIRRIVTSWRLRKPVWTYYFCVGTDCQSNEDLTRSIMDADIAEESTKLSKAQVLSQANRYASAGKSVNEPVIIAL